MSPRRRPFVERLAAMPRTCTRKNRYRTKARAINAIGKIRAAGVDTPLWEYKCRDCHGWHLTHKAPRKQQGAA